MLRNGKTRCILVQLTLEISGTFENLNHLERVAPLAVSFTRVFKPENERTI
ncbi:hypothetical protein JCM16163A_42720 [Paenibacillus sp. YK5]